MAAIGSQFSLVPIEAISDPELTPSEFKVLVALYSFRDKNADTAFPKLDSLAARAGFKDATQVSKLTTRLEKKGWLTKRQKMGFHGPKKYRLTIPDRLLGGGEIVQLGQFTQVGETEPDDSPNLDKSTNLGETPNTNLDKTTKSQVGQNYQDYKNRPLRTDQGNKPELPVATATAAVAALPVDNFTLPDLARIYASDEPETEIFNHGVPLLTRSGVDPGKARNFLQMLINKHSEGRVLDALMATILEMPVEPKSYLAAVCSKIGDEIPKDWVPPAPCLSELAGIGIPDDLVGKARDPFVIFFREQGIRHSNFAELFVRWCRRDWERVEGSAALYRQRLAASAGFGEEFREPA